MTMTKSSARKSSIGSLFGYEIVRVFVGPEQREFPVHKRLLRAASPYFQSSLDAVPAALARGGRSVPDLRRAARSSSAGPGGPRPPSAAAVAGGNVLWLPDESSEMFELFVRWLYRRPDFPGVVDEAVAAVTRDYPDAPGGGPPDPATAAARRALHWTLVRLHLFAALAGVAPLQDATTDALQDLYLRCDWDVTPRLLRFLYERCGADVSLRLRKWAVAMVAWQIHAAGPPAGPAGPDGPDGAEGGDHHRLAGPDGALRELLGSIPDLAADYDKHLRKMVQSGADLRVKNPQLRIPGNSLRGEGRHFGFRQCSFHSHRGAVGEGKCPHAAPRGPGAYAVLDSPGEFI